MATEWDRFCWQELSVDLSNLDSGPLSAMLTQPESYETKHKIATKKQIICRPVWLFKSSASNLEELARRFFFFKSST